MAINTGMLNLNMITERDIQCSFNVNLNSILQNTSVIKNKLSIAQKCIIHIFSNTNWYDYNHSYNEWMYKKCRKKQLIFKQFYVKIQDR